MSNTAVFNSQGNIVQYARKNLLINGDFSVWQRGTSFTAINEYTADRWVATGSPHVISRSTDVPAGLISSSPYSLDSDYTAGGGTLVAQQAVELPVLGEAGVFAIGQTLTLSMWVKSDVALRLKLAFRDSALSATNESIDFDTSGLLGDASNTWVKATHTWTMTAAPNPTNNNLSFIFIGLAGGRTFIKDVQVEIGDTATDFEYRHIAEELALCERYYFEDDQTVVLFNRGDTARTIQYFHPTTMRVLPTLVITGASPVAAVVVTQTVHSSRISINVTEAITDIAFFTKVTADAEIK